MSTVNRQPSGQPTGGQFATTARTESGVALAPERPAADFRAEVPIVAHFTVDSAHHDPLPEWPEGVPQPEVYWEYDDGSVETSFTFPSGDRVKFWTHNDENYSSAHDHGEQPSELVHEELQWVAHEWMSAVHDRVEAGAYGAVVATQTGEVQQAVIAAALGKPQPAKDRTPTDEALARAHAMLEAFNPRAAGLDFAHEPDDRRPALRDMLTDLRYLADLYGIDFDDAVDGSGAAFEEERELEAGA